MAKIFISYRRADSGVDHGAAARQIYDRLRVHFRDSHQVFLDEEIPAGVDFREYLIEQVAQCHVLLAVIGDEWVKVQKDGKRRLDDPNDWVRIEVGAALARKIPVMPVLLGKTPMPQEEDLPDDLKTLAYRHAAPVDPGKDFGIYMNELVRHIERILAVLPPLRPDDVDAELDVKVDLSRLPMTGRFYFGREKEMAQLDEA